MRCRPGGRRTAGDADFADTLRAATNGGSALGDARFKRPGSAARSFKLVAASRRAALSGPMGLPPLFCLPLYVFAERAIDAGLIAFLGLRVGLEPGDDVGIDAKRQLLLDGPI
jgi:hypothetical protein